jgi:hypothetical protein
MTSSFFCDVTQRRLVVSYRRFGTTYQSHLQGQRGLNRSSQVVFLDRLTLEYGTSRLLRNVGNCVPNYAASHKSNPSSVLQSYLEISTLGQVGGGNRCAGKFCRGLLRHTLADGVVVYPSYGGRYRAVGCMAVG